MKPHKAIINISTAVYELEPTGETGRSVGLKPLRDAEIKSFLVQIQGTTLDECLLLLKEKLEKIKNASA